MKSESTAADVPFKSRATGNPTTGPVHVDGAEPGEALEIAFLGFDPGGWGWTCVTGGFGICTNPSPAIRHAMSIAIASFRRKPSSA